MTNAEQPAPDDDAVKNAIVGRYEAETNAANARTDFWRRLAKWAVGALAVALAAILALALYAAAINTDTHNQGVQARHKLDLLFQRSTANETVFCATGAFLSQLIHTSLDHPSPTTNPTAAVQARAELVQLDVALRVCPH